MRWSDERWIKVYTRDTGDWLALGWEAQALFLLALRKADAAGVVRTGKMRSRGLAGMTGVPLDVVERAAPLLLEDGCLRESDGGYIIPNFMAAQEARTSDAQRKREQRERDRADAMASGMPPTTSGMVVESMAVTKRDAPTDIRHAMSSQNVTESHTLSQHVTPGHSASRLEERRREEKRGDLFPSDAFAPKVPRKARKPKPEKPTDPRHAPLTRELCETLGWPNHGGRTAKVVTELLDLARKDGMLGDVGYREVLRRAAIARVHDGFPRVRELNELEKHWGHFRHAQTQGAPRLDPNAGIMLGEGRDCAGCGESGDGAEVGEPVVWLGYGCGCMTEWSAAGQHYTKAAEWAEQRRREHAA